jgi:hypothetical protein
MQTNERCSCRQQCRRQQFARALVLRGGQDSSDSNISSRRSGGKNNSSSSSSNVAPHLQNDAGEKLSVSAWQVLHSSKSESGG